jgi:hypothetical protein
MTLSPAHENRAGRQLYFFDACKVSPEILTKYKNPIASSIWDANAVTQMYGSICTFYSTAPGHPAYGNVGGHSLFCEALLSSLNGEAAVRGEPFEPSNPVWRMTSDSLRTALTDLVPKLARNYGTYQTVECKQFGDAFDLRTYAKVPEGQVEIHIDPMDAIKRTKLELFEQPLMSTALKLVKKVAPVETTPCTISVQLGLYHCQAADYMEPRQYLEQRFLVDVTPRRQKVKIKFHCVPS